MSAGAHHDNWLDELTSTKGLSIGWDFTLLAATLWLLIWLPMAVVSRFDETHLFVISDVCICLIFAIDGYLVNKLHPDHRLDRGIVLRVVASFPVFALAYVFGWEAAGGPLIEINHLFITPILYHRLKWHLDNTVIGKGLKTVSILCVSFLIMHWIACAWMMLSPLPNEDTLTQYNRALYWSVTTLTTVGYGDITPTTNGTRLFTIVVMLLGVAFYGVVIGQVSQYMIQRDKRQERLKEQLDALNSFCRHYQVPGKLQQEALRFFRHHFAESVHENELHMISQLPSSLQREIEVYMNIKPLSRVSLFNQCSQECLVEAASMLERRDCAPREKIITSGDEAESMFVIGFGKVVVHAGGSKIAELSEGDCFGEMALILDRERRSDVTAVTYCDLFRLSRESLRSLLERHDDLRRNVDRLIHDRSRAG